MRAALISSEWINSDISGSYECDQKDFSTENCLGAVIQTWHQISLTVKQENSWHSSSAAKSLNRKVCSV